MECSSVRMAAKGLAIHPSRSRSSMRLSYGGSAKAMS
jgi:hypothetical protein